jgi:hypothetical protein
MKFEFSWQIFEKYSHIKSNENASSGEWELFHADGRTGMAKLIVALSNFANVPKIQLLSHSKQEPL